MRIERAIKAVGTPNPSGKQSFSPKHSVVLKIGVTKVEMKLPKLMAK
jgi:hypothetical protein